MTFRKRQLVIASLVVALGAAVYLNWQFSDPGKIETTDSEVSSSKQLGQTTYVNTELNTSEFSETQSSEKGTAENSADTKTKEKQTSTAATKKTNEFFADERKKRDKSNEQTIERLTDIIEAASTDEAAKKEAVLSAKETAENIKLQTDIESEVISKGFKDAYVIINNGSCSVTVYGGKLDDSSAIIIKDIVNRQADIDFSKITVASSGK